MNATQGMTTDRADVEAAGDTARRFALEELAPHIHAWDEAGTFPRSVYQRAAQLGLIGMGFDESLGGSPASMAMRNAVSMALARHSASGGLLASLFSHTIGLPPLARHGSAALQQRVIPPVLRGEKIAALAITEPGGGSDVASLRTTARREGNAWLINGEKTFITSGMRADWITVAVRTGEPGTRGAGGISMIVVPGDAAGLQRTELKKMGWWCSDTAHLRFDGVRVPLDHLGALPATQLLQHCQVSAGHRVPAGPGVAQPVKREPRHPGALAARLPGVVPDAVHVDRAGRARLPEGDLALKVWGGDEYARKAHPKILK